MRLRRRVSSGGGHGDTPLLTHDGPCWARQIDCPGDMIEKENRRLEPGMARIPRIRKSNSMRRERDLCLNTFFCVEIFPCVQCLPWFKLFFFEFFVASAAKNPPRLGALTGPASSPVTSHPSHRSVRNRIRRFHHGDRRGRREEFREVFIDVRGAPFHTQAVSLACKQGSRFLCLFLRGIRDLGGESISCFGFFCRNLPSRSVWVYWT